MKRFKPNHRPSYFLNKAMVLLHDIIEIPHFEYVNKAELPVLRWSEESTCVKWSKIDARADLGIPMP